MSILTALDGAARVHTDGHWTLMRFTTGYKCIMGTPNLDDGSGRGEVSITRNCTSLEDAIAHGVLRLFCTTTVSSYKD